jgi:hypothetical protein
MRVRPPHRAPPEFDSHLRHAEGTLDRIGAPRLGDERYHDAEQGLQTLVRRLQADSALLAELADLVGALEGLQSALDTPGVRAARTARDPAAPPTHSGQVRESRVEAPAHAQ